MTVIETLTTPHMAKLTVEDFLLLDRSGAFEGYAKSELIDGTIYVVNAQHRPHARAKSRLASAFAVALSGNPGLEVLTEVGIETGAASLPEPDIVITSEPEGEGFVPLASIHLLGEISDTSLSFDLGAKLGVYAQLAVPEYWVVDIRSRTIHQHWLPVDGSYAEKRSIAFGEPVSVMMLANVVVATESF